MAALRYQHCRWYDPYPRLAFALKLLGLSPEPVRVRSWELILKETESVMSGLFDELPEPAIEKPYGQKPARLLEKLPQKTTVERLMQTWISEQSTAETAWLFEGQASLRGYDSDSDLGVRALMLLKNSPDAVKNMVAEKLLAELSHATGSV